MKEKGKGIGPKGKEKEWKVTKGEKRKVKQGKEKGKEGEKREGNKRDR